MLGSQNVDSSAFVTKSEKEYGNNNTKNRGQSSRQERFLSNDFQLKTKAHNLEVL